VAGHGSRSGFDRRIYILEILLVGFRSF
jgi:hypothetical protein